MFYLAFLPSKRTRNLQFGLGRGIVETSASGCAGLPGFAASNSWRLRQTQGVAVEDEFVCRTHSKVMTGAARGRDHIVESCVYGVVGAHGVVGARGVATLGRHSPTQTVGFAVFWGCYALHSAVCSALRGVAAVSVSVSSQSCGGAQRCIELPQSARQSARRPAVVLPWSPAPDL